MAVQVLVHKVLWLGHKVSVDVKGAQSIIDYGGGGDGDGDAAAIATRKQGINTKVIGFVFRETLLSSKQKVTCRSKHKDIYYTFLLCVVVARAGPIKYAYMLIDILICGLFNEQINFGIPELMLKSKLPNLILI